MTEKELQCYSKLGKGGRAFDLIGNESFLRFYLSHDTGDEILWFWNRESFPNDETLGHWARIVLVIAIAKVLILNFYRAS